MCLHTPSWLMLWKLNVVLFQRGLTCLSQIENIPASCPCLLRLMVVLTQGRSWGEIDYGFWGTEELLQWYITAPQYIIVIVIYFLSLLLQLRRIIFNNTANVRAKKNPAIVEYELVKVAIHIKNNAMNWNIFLIMQQKSYSIPKVFQLFSAGDSHRANPVSLSDWTSLRQIADSIDFILIERHTGITVCESSALLH